MEDDDPAGHHVEADVQPAPGTPPAGAVLLDEPFAPGPLSFTPVLSTSRWIAPPVARGSAGSSRLRARRLRVEKLGTGRFFFKKKKKKKGTPRATSKLS